jgi:NAD(P)-dependent dehydrogenase (short-subunit alcohol dehydrogenase family)
MKSWLGDSERQHRVDLVIANAGISAGPESESPSEGVDSALRQIRVSLGGAINTIEPLLPAMCRRGRGRIAVVASIAASRGLPNSPGYRASKAGLRADAQALRSRLAPRGVGVTVVCPGFFDSAMTDRFEGPTPFLASAPRRRTQGQARHRSRPAAVGLSLALGLRFLRRGAGDRRRRDPAALPLSHSFSLNAR